MNRYTDGKVTTPINVADLSQLLNRSQEDINKVEYSNLLTSVGGLCTHPNINKWSKRKPVNSSILFADENALDEIMANANYGIDTSNIEYDDAEDFALGVTEDSVDYLYNNVGAPYQLSHFIKYNHRAKCPISVDWQTKTDDYGQTISATLLLEEQDLRGVDIIKNYIDRDGENIYDYYFSVAIIQNNSVIALRKADNGLNDVYDPYGREISVYLDEIQGMTDKTDTYAVAMLVNNSGRVISLNAERGAMSETIQYIANSVSEILSTITVYLDGYILTRNRDADYEYKNNPVARWDIHDITFAVTIPKIAEFMARYTTGKTPTSLQVAKWKMQIRSNSGTLYTSEDNGVTIEEVANNTWIDLCDYTFIPNADVDANNGLWETNNTEYKLFAENNVFFGTWVNSIYTDDGDYTYDVRLVLCAGGDSNTSREIGFGSDNIVVNSGDTAEM